MNFGGPVWHASARSRYGEQVSYALAEGALEGVGDRGLGEWREPGRNGTVHIRRRLTDEEAAQVNPVVDIRGTDEERERVVALLRDAPHLRRYFPAT